MLPWVRCDFSNSHPFKVSCHPGSRISSQTECQSLRGLPVFYTVRPPAPASPRRAAIHLDIQYCTVWGNCTVSLSNSPSPCQFMSYVVNQMVIQLSKWLFCVLASSAVSCLEKLKVPSPPAYHEWNSQQPHHGFLIPSRTVSDAGSHMPPQSLQAGRTFPL